ncbi:MAG TPA: VOC family protein [Bacteroidales bacterium]|nr:VOC family protein [Bacteroidales bacterium]
MKIDDSNVTIMVADLDRSIRFYESIGLKLKQKWEDHYAMVSAQGITIGLHPSDMPVRGSGSLSIGFMTGSLKEGVSLLEKNQIAYHLREGKSGKYAHFEDPDKTILYFVEPMWEESP